MRISNKILIFLINLFCLFLAVELFVNFFACRYFFPIKNAQSYGYLIKRSFSTLIPLNKYPTRIQSQIALPFEIVNYKLNNKPLKLSQNKETGLFGFKDSNGKIVIEEKFYAAKEFEKNYAIVAIKEGNSVKFGSIDKKGRWVIEPKYSSICTLSHYYTKACLDIHHCGVINIFGDEMTKMSYNLTELRVRTNKDTLKYFCSLDAEKNNNYCN